MKKIIPDKIAPWLVIIFGLLILVGGGYYVWAQSGYTAPNIPSPTFARPWSGTANSVDKGVHANEALTAELWNGLVNRVASLSSGTGSGAATYKASQCYAGDTILYYRRTGRTCTSLCTNIPSSRCTTNADTSWITYSGTLLPRFTCTYAYYTIHGAGENCLPEYNIDGTTVFTCQGDYDFICGIN